MGKSGHEQQRCPALMKKYVEGWYKSMKPAAWHDNDKGGNTMIHEILNDFAAYEKCPDSVKEQLLVIAELCGPF